VDALQVDDSENLIQNRDWFLYDTYKDLGVSGKNPDRRPELARLMEDAKQRRFDVLVVWRSDRLFRSLKHMVHALEELNALGIEFVSVMEPFDTTTPQGKLVIHVVSAFAEFERNLMIERTKAGIAAARKRGKRLGRPPVHIDICTALRLQRKGMSVRKMAKKLKVGASTLHRALKEATAEAET